MDKHSHVSSDFQLFLIPINTPVKIQMLLELLVDNCMDKALSMFRWGGNAQEIFLSDILNSFNYQQFAILSLNVETVAWRDSEDYRVYCDRRGWIDNDSEPYAYTYQGLLTQCSRCVRTFAATDKPEMNAIIQLPVSDEIDGPPWNDNEMEKFAHQCRIIAAYRESIFHHGGF
jgi:hypothetical protein